MVGLGGSSLHACGVWVLYLPASAASKTAAASIFKGSVQTPSTAPFISSAYSPARFAHTRLCAKPTCASPCVRDLPAHATSSASSPVWRSLFVMLLRIDLLGCGLCRTNRKLFWACFPLYLISGGVGGYQFLSIEIFC